MRKLRDDITVREIAIWMGCEEGRWPKFRIIGCMFKDLYNHNDRDDYPDSFYEQPPIGSFGKFWDDEPLVFVWHKLNGFDEKDKVYETECGDWYLNFTPCLPDDVDKDCMPK